MNKDKEKGDPFFVENALGKLVLVKSAPSEHVEYQEAFIQELSPGREFVLAAFKGKEPKWYPKGGGCSFGHKDLYEIVEVLRGAPRLSLPTLYKLESTFEVTDSGLDCHVECTQMKSVSRETVEKAQKDSGCTYITEDLMRDVCKRFLTLLKENSYE